MRTGFTLGLFFLAVASYAQSFDDVIASRRYIDCRDVTFNAAAICVNYNNPGGTPLDGQYFSIRLTIGSLGNHWRLSGLASLE